MPWSSQNGGGWRGGSGGGPWGQGPSGGGGNQGPDLEQILKQGQDRLKKAMPGGGGGVGGGVIALIVLAVLAFVGFQGFTSRVQPDEVGVVLRFGEFDRQLPPGLNFRLPYPVETVYKPKVTRVNRETVGFRGEVSGTTTSVSREVPEESLMLTGDENIVDINSVIFWRINNAEDFLFNIQQPEQTVKDVAESALREVAGESRLQPLLTRSRQETETAVQELMQTTLDDYESGILVTQVQLQKVDPPSQVIDAFRDVQAARADEERIQNEASAYANTVVPEARGEAARILEAAQAYKAQTVAEAEGQAQRFINIHEQYAVAPEVTRRRMFLETMERIFAGTEKIIIDEAKSGQGVVPYLPLNELQKQQGRTQGASQ